MIDRLRRLFSRPTDDGGVRPTVDAATAVQLVRDGATLLDVRERDEWRTGHAPQAVHVPLADVSSAAPRRLKDGATVVVVCASGMRSRTAARQLRSLGYAATSLSGGARRVAGRGRSHATLILHDPRPPRPSTEPDPETEPTPHPRRHTVCSPALCRTCGKTTWTGCGMHADEVMADVPPEQRCTCA